MIIYPHDPRFKFDIREDQPTDAVVIREIWCENVYEVFDGDLADTHIAVDLGANIGAFSLFALSLNPEAKVYAFEPQPKNYRQLLDNIRLNKAEGKVIPIQAGVSDHEGTAMITDEAGGSRVDDKGTDPITLTTLPKFWKQEGLEFVDVLKVDIEGSECAAITGALELLHLIRYIVVEYDEHAAKGDFAKIVTMLSRTHQLKIVGSGETGGYIYGRRY